MEETPPQTPRDADEFVKEIERVLEPGGRLHFWTDVLEYFESALETLAEATTLAGPFDVAEAAPEHDLDYRTHFERRTRLNREDVYRRSLRRGVAEAVPAEDGPVLLIAETSYIIVMASSSGRAASGAMLLYRAGTEIVTKLAMFINSMEGWIYPVLGRGRSNRRCEYGDEGERTFS